MCMDCSVGFSEGVARQGPRWPGGHAPFFACVGFLAKSNAELKGDLSNFDRALAVDRWGCWLLASGLLLMVGKEGACVQAHSAS